MAGAQPKAIRLSKVINAILWTKSEGKDSWLRAEYHGGSGARSATVEQGKTS